MNMTVYQVHLPQQSPTLHLVTLVTHVSVARVENQPAMILAQRLTVPHVLLENLTFYILPNNPCQSCLCGSNGQPTANCQSQDCMPQNCPSDKMAVTKPGTCDYDCVPRLCTPGETYPSPRDSCNTSTCGPSGNPSNNDPCTMIDCPPCNPGEFYTLLNDPCQSCLCGDD